ncbi:MAG: hypothetical protein QHC40_07905 [Sphingobium sp.]|nr:hypothetical protein [Sphingobium sp.]
MEKEEKVELLISLVEEAISYIKSYLMGDFDPMEVREDMRSTMRQLEKGLEKAKF